MWAEGGLGQNKPQFSFTKPCASKLFSSAYVFVYLKNKNIVLGSAACGDLMNPGWFVSQREKHQRCIKDEELLLRTLLIFKEKYMSFLWFSPQRG